MRLYLLFLLLLVSQSFSFSRPFLNSTWIDENPNIYRGIYWNLPSFDRTLTSINLDLFSDPNFSTSQIREKYLLLAHQKETALEKSHKCQTALSPFFNLSLLTFDRLAYSSSSFLQFINIILTIQDCLDYSSHFNIALDQSLGILDIAKSDSRVSISGANSAYTKLVLAGICSSSYSGEGSENCETLDLTFKTSVSESVFGKPQTLELLESEIESQLNLPSPTLSPFSSYLDLVYGKNGIVIHYSNLTKVANSSLERAKSSQKNLFALANSKLTNAKLKSNYYSNQKINLILYGGSSDLALNQKHSQIIRNLEEIQSNISLSKSLETQVSKTNYLADAISLLDSSISKLDLILLDLDSISDSASFAISQIKEEARFEISVASEIESSLNSDGKKSLEISRSLFLKADSSETLGEIFQSYFDSAKYARIAKTQTTSSSINSSLIESDLSNLITRAESDSLDVSSEKALLRLYLSSLDPQIPPLIKSMILEKTNSSLASPLLTKRARIANLIRVLGSSSEGFSSDLSNLDRAYFDGTRYDLEKTLGHFSFLDAQYSDLEVALLSFSKEMVSNSLSVSSSTHFDSLSFNSKPNASISFVLTNYLNLSASNVSTAVSLDYPVSFQRNDFTVSKNRLSSTALNGHSLVLILYAVSPFESIDFEATTQPEVLKVVSISNSSTGFSDGSASIVSSYTVDILSKIPRLDLPKVLGPIERGRYTFNETSYLSNAYNYSLASSSVFPIGQRANIEFDVKINPIVNLDTLSFSFPLTNSSSVSKFSIVSFGEGKIDSYLLDKNLIHLKIKNLKSGKQLTIRTSFEVDNSQNYSAILLASLPSTSANTSFVPPSLSALISSAKTEYQKGNFTGSISLSQKALSELDRIQSDLLKTQKESLILTSAIDQEISEISSALSSFGTNSTFSKKLLLRLDYLRSILISDPSSYDSKWLDSEIKSKSKDFSKEYSSLIKDSAKFNDSSLASSILEADSAILRFETSRDLVSALIVDDLLQKSRTILDSLKNTKTSDSNLELYSSLSSTAEKTLSSYKSQKNLAKNTSYYSLFTVDDSSVSSSLKDLKNYLDSDYRIFQYKLNSINSSVSIMNSQLNLLKNTATSKLSLISPKIPAEKISSISSLIQSSNYVGALKELDKLIDSNHSSSNQNSLSPYLLMGSVALVALILIYLIMTKYKKSEPPKQATPLEKLSDSNDPSDF